MHSFAQYALLGSLLAGAAGVLVLIAVTLKHGIRRQIPDADDEPGAAQRTLRTIRLADTVAVVCFAVAAGLGVFGLMQQTQAMATAPRADEAELAARLQELEERLATAEALVHVRGIPARPRSESSPPSWEERVARLERRLGSMEERTANGDRIAGADADERSPAAPAATPRRAPAATAATAPAPKRTAGLASSAPRATAKMSERMVSAQKPDESGTTITPAASPSASASGAALGTPPSEPAIVTSAPVTVAPPPAVTPPLVTVASPASRESTPPRPAPPARDPTLGQKLESDWETVKARRAAQRRRMDRGLAPSLAVVQRLSLRRSRYHGPTARADSSAGRARPLQG